MARKPVNLKAAPRKSVVGIDRIGSWGRVEYHHKLECGHVEIRKRPSASGTMACAGCVLTEEHQQRAETANEQPDVDELILDELNSRLAGDEKTISQVKASVASHYKVPIDSVEVIVEAAEDQDESFVLSSVVIILSADEVVDLLR